MSRKGLEFLRREEGSGNEAIARLIREAAFTHLNRLIAIRIAEAIGLLPESLVKGSSSGGFKDPQDTREEALNAFEGMIGRKDAVTWVRTERNADALPAAAK